MNCGFCGRPIPDTPDPERPGCGTCSGGCRKVHCPHCGYANPAVPGRWRQWLRKNEREEKS